MKQLVAIYHCCQCKRIIYSVEELLFVEDGSNRGFCRESCINDYFASHIAWYEECENSIRQTCSVSRSSEAHSFDLLDDPKYVDSTLRAPDEIWKMQNHLKEEVYIFISHFGSTKKKCSSVIVICTVFNFVPSFVFLVTMTSSEKILDSFRTGDEIIEKGQFLQSAITGHNSDESSSSLETLVAAKKSSLLAEMLSVRVDADIPLESFPLYNSYLENTLQDADEIYRIEDVEGDILYSYIKSYDEGGVSFYYIVLCLPAKGEDNGAHGTIIPIISFPTLNSSTYQYFCSDERISGVIKN
ncbi:MAG: hypothetical protein HN353_04410 [Bdellovibrionales bacterium]|nr:hypothetical protein [Bdellovibrionales bacterium]MBT3527472.1 hypothetical protein [Bdellovibrionales bacterium]MBT7669216.1 hypothetical protein [Bdellovibrionales bacterium]MBT7766023.1 hypothetical protein [Bdellovibrionales bacterium]